MNALNKQELQIIEAFSSASIPEKIIRDSNIKGLIQGMITEQKAVEANAAQLQRMRQEKQEGNFLGNWWDDRTDKIQNAQLDLSQTIGRLTEKSSQLLIVNTAISKVLTDQQRILLEQQSILKQQTNTLEKQNRKILDQQKLLEEQQRDINKANQGLMEAKGLTQEQAKKLIGCVTLVNDAESRISDANQSLRSSVEQSLHISTERCLERLNSGFAEQEQRYDAFEQQVISKFSTQAQQALETLKQITAESAEIRFTIQQHLTSAVATLGQRGEALDKKVTTALLAQSKIAQAELERFSTASADIKDGIRQQLLAHIQPVLEKFSAYNSTTQQLKEEVRGIELKQGAVLNDQNHVLKATKLQLAALQAEQEKSAKSNRLAVAMVATLTLVSLGWQIAQHLALM